MARIKLEFANIDGQVLAGLLETPQQGVPISRYALFAHCFTCGKDIAAASRISRALARRGIAVLRFDLLDCLLGGIRQRRIGPSANHAGAERQGGQLFFLEHQRRQIESGPEPVTGSGV